MSDHHELKHIERRLDRIDRLLCAILTQLGFVEVELEEAKGLELTQFGGNMGVITGIAPGATETFDLSTLPIGSLLQAGSVPTYTQDNTTDVTALTAQADGMSFAITGQASFASGAVLNVTANAVSLNGSPLSQVFNIPLNAGTGGGVAATSLDLNQRSSGVTAAARLAGRR